jgi:hypothetical protein
MQRLAIDTLGPLPSTERNNKYIIVVADYFTKWVEAFPTQNQEAITVADILINHVISRFGVPLELRFGVPRSHLRLTFNRMKGGSVTHRALKPLSLDKPVLVFNPTVAKGCSPKLECGRDPFN